MSRQLMRWCNLRCKKERSDEMLLINEAMDWLTSKKENLRLSDCHSFRP